MNQQQPVEIREPRTFHYEDDEPRQHHLENQALKRHFEEEKPFDTKIKKLLKNKKFRYLLYGGIAGMILMILINVVRYFLR